MRRKVEASPSPWLPTTDGVAVYYPRPIAFQLRKRKLKEEEEETSPLSALPYDVALLCLARVRRSDHAALSLLSQSFRSLAASPELQKIRSMMGITDTEVYVCLLRTPNPGCWYILRRDKTSSSLIPIASSPSQHLESSAVALGSAIYVIGGKLKGIPTSEVLRLDCLTHTWHRVPSMGVARASALAAVVDGKIYVVGGCDVYDFSLSWGEVFDPKTQAWEFLPLPRIRNAYLHDCVVRDGKFYVVTGLEKTHYYSPREGIWGLGNRGVMTGGSRRRDWCMIGNLMYSINQHGRIFWCEQEELDWRELDAGIMDWWNEVKGLEALTGNLSHSRLVHFGVNIVNAFKHLYSENTDLAGLLPGARLCNSGGGGNNMLLFWDEMVGNIQKIWCAEISLERRQREGEIWGNVEWSRAVMTVADDDPFARPRSCKVLHSVSVTL